MKTIYILHYHLNPGGVSRIIESQVQGLKMQKPQQRVVILTGHVADAEPFARAGAEIIVHEPFNYLTAETTADYESLLPAISKFLTQHIKEGDILHVHNINLGKNPVLTLAVHDLAERGVAVVNHCHDFAEDRPANLAFLHRVIENSFGRNPKTTLYPDFGNYCYIVLNSYDRDRLVNYGVARDKIHWLPNPVRQPGRIDRQRAEQEVRAALNLSPDKRIVTYPVRVIRRKNIGEYILLAHLFRTHAHWLVTQPPKNPVEIEFYEKWKRFCVRQGINIHFQVGEIVDFDVLMTASDFCFTTSVQEGFGMAFLEPWSYGTPVIGRDIPSVTGDLKASGMRFPLLYEQLVVEFNGKKRDFSSLSQQQQMSLIKQAHMRDDVCERIFELNSFLQRMWQKISTTLIEHNRAVLKQNFSISAYGKRLFAVYDAIA